MENTTLEVTPRETGKRGARASRKAGQVPCVIYGPGIEARAFQVPALALQKLVRSHEASIIELKVNGKKHRCILKEVDFHPVLDYPIHADFQAIRAGEKITLTVPFHFEGTPVGQISGGDTQFVLNEVDITCVPENIPSHLTIDISHLDIGDAIHIGDLEFEDIEFEAPPKQTVVSVLAPRLVEEPVVEEEEGVEGEEGAEEAGEAAESAEENEE